jgi:site-specific DNA recombinase
MSLNASGNSRYFLYARKSTDTEDKQIRSIDDQKTELMDFARAHQIAIAGVFEERRTAKTPGRPVFNEMLARIERGEADAVLAWHPDRLARNSIDGGRLIYLVDTGAIADLKFPTFWFDATSQGKLMLSIAFGMSKYYVDNLAENIKRGMRQKLRNGILPGQAPVGYLNNRATKTIAVDPGKSVLVRRAFELYATGTYAIRDLLELMTNEGLTTHTGKPMSLSNIQAMLQHPFYYGLIRSKGELYEGRHAPIITKALFDNVQNVMAERGRPRKMPRRAHFYQGVFRCGECGCAVTTETKKGHTYLRCTKRKHPCSQRYLREEEASRQIRRAICQVAMPQSWISPMLDRLDLMRKERTATIKAKAGVFREQIATINGKIDRLTAAYLDTTVASDVYQRLKSQFLDEKTSFREKLAAIEANPSYWIEQARTVIGDLNRAIFLASEGTPAESCDFLRKIGSNLTVRDAVIGFEFREPWKNVATKGRFVGRGLRARVSVAPQHVQNPRMSRKVLATAPGWIAVLDDVLNLFQDSPPNRIRTCPSPHPSRHGEGC